MNVASSVGKGVVRTSPQLYRDCLRLAQHIAGKSKKGRSLKEIIRNEFRRNMHETDPHVIENLKSNAIRGLANYLMIESANKDKRLQSVAEDYTSKAAGQLLNHNLEKPAK